ncbi:MAG TPA: molybdenum cofactor biosynthesis protein MoaE [Pyrinomonadaceae bacterium]|nr:molybdenum cofactor biosynthesis protein MoaE [Pyrinomonadaceae bacterium]
MTGKQFYDRQTAGGSDDAGTNAVGESPARTIMANGAMDFCEITIEALDINSVARRGAAPECGATVTLDGYARRFTKKDGKVVETEYLIYEAYDEMALKEMSKLIDAAHLKFEISNIGIVHRIGRLEIGETSVVISVAAPHRKDAFAACEWLIKELKRTVPIWKKEVYLDGEAWAVGESVV